MSLESGPAPESELSNEELIRLLSAEARPDEHVKGLLALGLTEQDLFGALEVEEADMRLITEDEIDDIREKLGDDEDEIFKALVSFGASEEELLAEGVDAFIERRVEEENRKKRERFNDPDFLSRRGRRVFDDLRATAATLMESNEENRYLIASWLKTPNHTCDGERPLDRIKVDPIQVRAAAHEPELSIHGRLSDLYGHMEETGDGPDT